MFSALVVGRRRNEPLAAVAVGGQRKGCQGACGQKSCRPADGKSLQAIAATRNTRRLTKFSSNKCSYRFEALRLRQTLSGEGNSHGPIVHPVIFNRERVGSGDSKAKVAHPDLHFFGNANMPQTSELC